MVMDRYESIVSSLQIADDWQKKGQPMWVSNCLNTALTTYLSVSLIDHNDPSSGIEWMKAEGVVEIVRRYQETLLEIIAQVESGRLPTSVIAGNYDALVFAHLAWCLGAIDLGEWFVEFSEREDVLELSTKFWREYARAIGALTRDGEYHLIKLSLRRQERYWVVYLRLIDALCSHQPLGEIVKEVENAFRKRNADKSIRDDAFQIEGSFSQPVNWDFRRHSLLEYAKNRSSSK